MIQSSFRNDKPTIYFVSTPIGNLDDITFRAIKTLKKVDKIYCEDTRVSSKLLAHFDIQKPLFQYHDHNKDEALKHIEKDMTDHLDIAVISDAGTPVISDPGFAIVKTYKTQANIVPIPGPSAVITALSASGLPPHPFMFYGFLPSKTRQRQKLLKSLKTQTETLIFYESPHRLSKTLSEMKKIFKKRDIVIARELTKRYEEFIRTDLDHCDDLPPLKGEIVLLVAGYTKPEMPDDLTILEEITQYMNDGLTSKQAIKKCAKRRNLPKNTVYMEYHNN